MWRGWGRDFLNNHFTIGRRFKPPSIQIAVLTFLLKKKYNKAFQCKYFENTRKFSDVKSRPRIQRSLLGVFGEDNASWKWERESASEGKDWTRLLMLKLPFRFRSYRFNCARRPSPCLYFICPLRAGGRKELVLSNDEWISDFSRRKLN